MQLPKNSTQFVKSVFSRLLFSGLLISIFDVAAVSNSAGAAPLQEAARQESITPQCGVKVYMTASGSDSSSDPQNDSDVETSLETNTDLCITVGVEYTNLASVAGTVTTANYDVIYLQGQNNWYSSDLAAFGDNDLDVIENFLSAGGGLVIGEWHAWNECVSRSTQSWIDFATLMPVIIKGNCLYGSNQNVRFYRWERPLSSLIDAGVASDFVFEPADFAGSLSFLDMKTGATPYYWATWDSVVANIPAASDPTDAGFTGGVGMAGWVPNNYTGRVFSFSTTNGAPELADTSSANSFRRLLVNALGWAGSVGGSINPDAVSVTAQVGTNLTTPAFVPTRMTGSITYSIISGTLPNGLTLNPSTGQITGTPTQGGDINVTIQATSSSGQAVAAVVISIAGGSNPSTPTTPTTPSSGGSSTTPTSTPATTTTVARVDAARSLPATGSSSVPQLLIAMIVLGSGLLIHRRHKLS